MNQSSKSHKQESSSSTTAWPDSTIRIQRKKQKQKLCSRSPFQDLNNGGAGVSNGSNKEGYDSNSNASSISSVEAPKGCLRFFLSHTSSAKTPFINGTSQRPTRVKLSKTPKSAPNVRPNKENLPKRNIFHKPISQKLQKVKLEPSQSVRKPKNLKISSVLGSSGNPVNKLISGSTKSERVVSDADGSNFTPLSKVASGFVLNLAAVDSKVITDVDDDKYEKSNTNNSTNTNSTSANTKTPPVQASVSPEIQCGSSMVSAANKTITPVCYGAGYLVSGVTDKRKCRPRGILTVGEAMPLDCFESDDELEKENASDLVNNSSVSILPLPAEASMHWLLSPCDEEDDKDQKENSEKGLCRICRLEESAGRNFSVSPPPGNDVFSPDLSSGTTDKSISIASAKRKTKNASLLSPSGGFMGPPLYDKANVLCSEEKRKDCIDLDEQRSPVSVDSLGSGNVIQTPQSDFSSDRGLGISWLNANGGRKNHDFDCELNSVTQHLQMASLSPKNHESIWDPTSSSFQFDCLTTPSNSVDLLKFQKILDDRTSWFSNSSMENVSQSQMRISWREGLVSRIFEMDEFDSCRCLSDEEDDTNGCNDDSLKSLCSPKLNVDVVDEQISTNCSVSTIFVDNGHEIDEKAKGLPPQVPCSCAESISTDAGDLVRSEDSDWTLCYKNHLFQT
ncbi:hypothetical protein JCGZ_19259 [Jatropha curcas]|uniref:Uncharacterized protein n=1 Tax=Jatropha curcas TaxID=180498 RepID=A0A067JZZ3_JATCU|nr:uncharacterized protein LOC105641877 [Jatropha curcas]KDP29546.1 hypothetical protein JCGZ_19259 [Jatropha curcas]